MDGAFVGRTVLVQGFEEGWQLGVIESYKDKLYYIEYGRRAASLPAANDLIIRHCGKRRKVNDLADHNQFPMRLFGNHINAKQGSWALLKSQSKQQAVAQPAQKGKRKALASRPLCPRLQQTFNQL